MDVLIDNDFDSPSPHSLSGMCVFELPPYLTPDRGIVEDVPNMQRSTVNARIILRREDIAIRPA